MRIIAGTAKGHTIQAPKGWDTRPTQDRVRESIFNVLQSRYNLFETAVLDLFSGTGALAIEALSRGASKAIAVDTRTQQCIQKNAIHCKVDAYLQIIKMPVEIAVSNLKGTQFDIIFSDPPYEKGYVSKTMELVDTYSLLRPGGFLVIERHKDEEFEAPLSWSIVKELAFGYTRVTFCTYHP